MPEPWSRTKLAAVTIGTRRGPFGSFWYRTTRSAPPGRPTGPGDPNPEPTASGDGTPGRRRRLRSRRTGRIPGLPRFRRRPGPRRCRCRARPSCGAPTRPGPARCRCWPPGRPGGQQRDLVTMPGTGPEDLFGVRQARRRDHRGRQRRLSDHLMAGDGDGRVVIGPGGVPADTIAARRVCRIASSTHGSVTPTARAAATRFSGRAPVVTLHPFSRLDKGLRGDLPSPALSGSGPRGRHSAS